MKREGLKRQKLTKQRSKLLCKKAGGELDDLMFGSMVEKMQKGGNAKRNAFKGGTHQESLQDYKLGGWTHSAPKKKK